MTEKNEVAIIAMLEQLIASTKNTKNPQVDQPRLDHLATQMEGNILATNDLTERLSQMVEQVQKPTVHERRITIDIRSKEAVFIFIGCLVLITVLASALYLATRPDYDRDDNDLKYRYIKMKGEAAPERISELEDIFELHRNNSKIRQLRKDVEEYEQMIRERIILEEQMQLKEAVTKHLQQKEKLLRNK